MLEMLRLIYRSFLNEEDEKTSGAVRYINSKMKETDNAIEILEKTVSNEQFDELYNLIVDGACEIQEAGFIAGYAYCALLMSDGQIDLLQNTATTKYFEQKSLTANQTSALTNHEINEVPIVNIPMMSDDEWNRLAYQQRLAHSQNALSQN